MASSTRRLAKAVIPSPTILPEPRTRCDHFETENQSESPTNKKGVSAVNICLIEDNPGDVLLIQQILSAALPSVHIRVAMDGEQGLEMLCDSQFRPDLIILDLNIPKIPGIALLAQCRPTAPVVVFSSSSNPAEIRRAKELGVREFVHKPIDFEEFDRVVRRIIQDWAQPAANGTASG